MDEPAQVTNRALLAISRILVDAVRITLKSKGGVYLSGEPEILEKPVVQFSRHMRVDALEKFGERTVFSVVNFYHGKHRMEHHQPAGTLIFYIPVSYISKLLWMLEYPRIDEDDDGLVLDGCGSVANLVAGAFVKELCGKGYVHLEMSHFESYINTAVNGVEFPEEESLKHEISFSIGGVRRLVAELTMSHVPNY